VSHIWEFFSGAPKGGGYGCSAETPPPFWTSEICGFQGFLKPNDYWAPGRPPLMKKKCKPPPGITPLTAPTSYNSAKLPPPKIPYCLVCF